MASIYNGHGYVIRHDDVGRIAENCRHGRWWADASDRDKEDMFNNLVTDVSRLAEMVQALVAHVTEEQVDASYVYDIAENVTTLMEDYGRLSTIADMKQGDTGDRGAMGAKGDQGPTGPSGVNTPEFQELLERMKDIESKYEELSEAVEDLEQD